MPFLDSLDTRAWTRGRYKLLSDFRYQVPNSYTITVPAGFITDFASVPQGFRWLVTGHGDTRKPAVIHDWLCRAKPVTRKVADDVFLTAMKENGVATWKRNLCYAAVRAAAIVSGKG